MKRIMLIAGTCLTILLMGTIAFAQGSAETKAAPAKAAAAKATPAKPAKPAMAAYLIESPHTAEECLAVMDDVNKMKGLGAWDWGCMSGNHTGYRVVRAADENAALAMVPASVRGKAHANKVSKMTAEQLAAAHKHM